MEQAVTITFQDSAREPVDGTLTIAELGLKGRLKRSLLALGICWGAAFPLMLFPGPHMLLIPPLIIAGPIIAFVRFRKTIVLAMKELPCPKCGKPVPIEEGTAGWPAKVMCQECSARLIFTPR